MEETIEKMPQELPKILQDHKDKFDHVAGELEKRMDELHKRGNLLHLTKEEMDMLAYFKKFKNALTKPSVFTWQTIPYTNEERKEMNARMEALKA